MNQLMCSFLSLASNDKVHDTIDYEDNLLDARNPDWRYFQHSFDSFNESYDINVEYFAILKDASVLGFYNVFIDNELLYL